MAQQIINVGLTADDRTGDPLRVSFTKINSNFSELYNSVNAIAIPSDISDLTDIGGLLGDSFDQALNTTDDVTFNSVEITTGVINAPLGTGFSVITTGASPNELSFSSQGVLNVPGESVFNANIYGGSNNRLWLGGGNSEVTPSITIPNETEGVSTYLWIQNQLGGGVTITTDGGDWGFSANGTIVFPDNTTQSTGWGGGSVVSVPTTSVGIASHSLGDIAFDSTYFYYCTANYDGVSNIWKRTAWSNDTW